MAYFQFSYNDYKSIYFASFHFISFPSIYRSVVCVCLRHIKWHYLLLLKVLIHLIDPNDCSTNVIVSLIFKAIDLNTIKLTYICGNPSFLIRFVFIYHGSFARSPVRPFACSLAFSLSLSLSYIIRFNSFLIQLAVDRASVPGGSDLNSERTMKTILLHIGIKRIKNSEWRVREKKMNCTKIVQLNQLQNEKTT